LQSLNGKMASYCTYAKMQDRIEPKKVYQGAIEFEAGMKKEMDEAKTDNVALWSHEPAQENQMVVYQPGGKGQGKGAYGGKGKGYGGKGKGGERAAAGSCGNCGVMGHSNRDCQNPCGFCWQWGHKKYLCPADPAARCNQHKRKQEETANAVEDMEKMYQKKIKKMKRRAATLGCDVGASDSD
jgi:hypothetical protein